MEWSHLIYYALEDVLTVKVGNICKFSKEFTSANKDTEVVKMFGLLEENFSAMCNSLIVETDFLKSNSDSKLLEEDFSKVKDAIRNLFPL